MNYSFDEIVYNGLTLMMMGHISESEYSNQDEAGVAMGEYVMTNFALSPVYHWWVEYGYSINDWRCLPDAGHPIAAVNPFTQELRPMGLAL